MSVTSSSPRRLVLVALTLCVLLTLAVGLGIHSCRRRSYRCDIYDVYQIQVTGTLPGHPIGPMDDYGRPTCDGGFYLVEPEGIVNLGPAYGTVQVAGMRTEEMQEAISRHLQQTLWEPAVSVKLVRAAGNQPSFWDRLLTEARRLMERF